jgi:acyl-CoA synthetase (AMP-forming)/AMP-acid ligase II
MIDEKSTKGAIDEEGWQHTGDVAHIDHCGRFAIIDRVKVGGHVLYMNGFWTIKLMTGFT